MPTPEAIQKALAKVRDFKSFSQILLRDTMEWPIPDEASEIEDLGYTWTEHELSTHHLSKNLIDGQIHQLLLDQNQPWGIFSLVFKNDEVFHNRRGFVTPLREILRGLVDNKRNRTRNQAMWGCDNLLFICTHGFDHFTFVHFSDPRKEGRCPRLTSFGWNPGEPNRTVVEYNLPHLVWPENTSSPKVWQREWLQAFDKEQLTRNFFGDFDVLYSEVKADIASAKRKNLDPERESLLLVNRLLFLYFVQKKGWLARRHDFFRREFEQHRGKPEKTTFSRDFLTPLFDRLAMPDCMDERFKEIPYLNGGLFEADSTIKDPLPIRNATFARLFDDLLERYNFTVAEDTPLDVEVAIDPEMLGNIFERVVTGRHDTGSYYTPRPIVSFMCKEALKGYLGESMARLVEEYNTDGINVPQARELLKKLEQIKVVDPACGSGAYLVGMLHELHMLGNLLDTRAEKVSSRDDYERKLEIIRNNLYGVDIDEIAVSIARLRLWLSLIIEFQGNTPPSLPNLDFKIECENSISGPTPGAAQLDLFADNHIKEFEKKKAEYSRANVYENKTRLRKKIDELRYAIAEAVHPGAKTTGFDWAVEFAEVFNRPEGSGFDIVLANPPYVRQELIKELKPALKQRYADVYTGTADLYCYFYARGIDLLRPEGMLVFISSNKWFRASYGEKLREYIGKHCRVISITDFEDLPVFEGATAYPMIFVARKVNTRKAIERVTDNGQTTFTQVKTLEPPYPDVLAVIVQNGMTLPKGAIKGKNWTLANAETTSILRRIESVGVPLGRYVNGQIYRGVLTGLNVAFVIDGKKRAELIAEDPKSAEIIKPFLRGRDVKRWRTEFAEQYLIKIESSENKNHPWSGKSEKEAEKVFKKTYPAIYEHFQSLQNIKLEKLDARGCRNKLEQLKSRDDQGKYFWELRSCAYWKEFEQPKIVIPAITSNVEYAADYEMHFSNDKTSICVANKPNYLLGLLNSKVLWWFIRQTAASKQGGFYEFKPMYVSVLPIPAVTPEKQKPVELLVERILSAKQRDPRSNVSAMEREIDKLVYALYGLMPEETKQIEEATR